MTAGLPSCDAAPEGRRQRQAQNEVRQFSVGHGRYHDVVAAARLLAGGEPTNRAERRAAARAEARHASRKPTTRRSAP